MGVWKAFRSDVWEFMGLSTCSACTNEANVTCITYEPPESFQLRREMTAIWRAITDALDACVQVFIEAKLSDLHSEG